jgi:hypothetical protein
LHDVPRFLFGSLESFETLETEQTALGAIC